MHQWLLPHHPTRIELKSCRSCHVHGASQTAPSLPPRTRGPSCYLSTAKQVINHIPVILNLHSRASLSRCRFHPLASRASAPKGFPFLSCRSQEIIRPFHLLCLQVVMLCNFLQPATEHFCLPGTQDSSTQQAGGRPQQTELRLSVPILCRAAHMLPSQQTLGWARTRAIESKPNPCLQT